LWVSELQLASFRNYQSLQTKFSEGRNLIYGPNGEGKTNLVEAIGYLSSLSSHRLGSQKSLVREGDPSAQLSATVKSGDRELAVGVEINTSSANKFFINGSPRQRASEILGNLAAVVFAPEDLDVVRRDPADRRGFLDQTAALLKPRIGQLRLDYDRVLKQRNALLKSSRGVKNPDLSTLDIWDDQLVELGSHITQARFELLGLLGPTLQSFYSELSGSTETIELQLVSLSAQDDLAEIDKDHIASQLRENLQRNRAQELERGITLFGPHRDELLITKAGLLARSHASQGEAWSLALGLKLAVAAELKDRPGGDPVVILDDVFAVLDPGRRARLVEFVKGFQQVLVTAADPAATPELSWDAKFSVSQGEVTRD
jgi:DNA replication and repair protein RecF